MKFTTTHLLYFLVAALSFSTSCKDKDPVEPDTISTAEIIDSDISTTRVLVNRELDPSKPDYCITKFIAIKNGAGLIIEPGVTIEFSSDAGISVGTYTEKGYLVAAGNDSNRIIFTGKSKIPGFWRGIAVSPTNVDPRNVLDYCTVEHAGSSMLNASSAGFGYKSAIGVGAASNGSVGQLSIKNTIIRNNNGKGYSCKGESGLNQFVNNEFVNNTEQAIYIGAIGFTKIDGLTTFSGNGFNGIYQDAIQSSIETILDASVHTWVNKNGPYFLSRGIRLNNVSATLNISADVEVIMGSGTLINCSQGTLNVNGESNDNRVVIRGETSSVPSWKGILIESGSNNVIRYCDISEGGSAVFLTNGCNGKANIGIFYWAGNAGKATVTNCALRYSGGCGMYNETKSETQKGDLTQSDNGYYGNASDNICN